MCLFNRGTKYLYWLYLYLPLFYMKVYLRVYAVGVTWDIIPPVRGGFCGQVSCSIPVTLGRTRVSPQSEALVKSPVVKKKWNRIDQIQRNTVKYHWSVPVSQWPHPLSKGQCVFWFVICRYCGWKQRCFRQMSNSIRKKYSTHCFRVSTAP